MLDALDDRWRADRRSDLVLGEPLLGTISAATQRLLTQADMQQPRGQQCIALRAELLLHTLQSRPTLLVTGARHAPHRHRLGADLARVFARSGQRVLLVDASLSEEGVSALLGSTEDTIRTLLRDPDQPIAELERPTDLDNLVLLPGHSVSSTAQLLPALHWPLAIAAIERAAPFTIVDGPAILEGADAALLAPAMGGVILVIDPRTEHCSDTRTALERLRASQAPVLGVVMLSYPPRTIRELIGGLWPHRRSVEPMSALR